MKFDNLIFMAKGVLSNWNRAKLEKKLRETAETAIDGEIKIAQLKERNRQLEDQIRILIGEKPKPVIKPVSSNDLNPPEKKAHSKSSKKDKIEIDEQVDIEVEEKLPKDAKFVGQRKIVIQELRLERRNICFNLKRYYSHSLGKTFEGKIPDNFKGREFGPQLISFIIYQYYKNRVPHKKIECMLSDLGIKISAGTICSLLNDLPEDFSDDLRSSELSGLKKCNFAHFDDTGAKFNGQNYYTFGLSNPYFTKFTTLERKKKESVKQALELNGKLRGLKFLITDDAPNFRNLVKRHQLCWVHEIRKYKLCELYKRFESQTLEKLLRQWRGFYKKMKNYRKNPSDELGKLIESEFARITSIVTLVKPLDEQLKRTAKLKDKLLLFLQYPFLPIENNQIERDLRERVIKRKISLQNRSLKGLRAWDLMLSLASTCRKINLSFWNYLTDRTCKRESIPYLGKIIASI